MYAHAPYSRPKAAGIESPQDGFADGVSHSRPKAAGSVVGQVVEYTVSNTAARRRLEKTNQTKKKRLQVSTHSRPKAAGLSPQPKSFNIWGFNTQPPEGGWQKAGIFHPFMSSTQPPEGGWSPKRPDQISRHAVSNTAARRRLRITFLSTLIERFQQPPEGGWQTGSRHIKK